MGLNQPLPLEQWLPLKARLAHSPFRSGFQLDHAAKAAIAAHGWDTIANQCRQIIEERLAPAEPHRDGQQTPMRGFCCFTAQHATGCCCRGCLAKWHHIARHRPLTEAEVDHVVAVLLAWLHDQMPDEEISRYPFTPDLL